MKHEFFHCLNGVTTTVESYAEYLSMNINANSRSNETRVDTFQNLDFTASRLNTDISKDSREKTTHM